MAIIIFVLFGLGDLVAHAQAVDTLGTQMAKLVANGSFEEARQLLKNEERVGASGVGARFYAGRLARSDGKAKVHFRAVAGASSSPHADEAAFELAESDYSDPRGLYVSARRHFQQFVDRFPNSPLVPLALYRIGRTHLITSNGIRSTQLDSAAMAFQEVLNQTDDPGLARFATYGLRQSRKDDGQGKHPLLLLDNPPPMPVDSAPGQAQAEPSVEQDKPEFWVQVGAFTQTTLIDGLVDRLSGVGLVSRLVPVAGMTLVQVGPYRDREDAERAKRQIAISENLTSRIIQE